MKTRLVELEEALILSNIRAKSILGMLDDSLRKNEEAGIEHRRAIGVWSVRCLATGLIAAGLGILAGAGAMMLSAAH